MVNFNTERAVAVVYPCGVCNLNCRYCTIDKNPVLKDIDDELDESFKGDYYFNRIKEYFPRRDQLKTLETWGGEPFLHMERVYPLIHQLIDYYPYFDCAFSSTNFSFDNWIDKFMGLMNCFAAYPYREFKYNLQLSVDGPEYINDTNRGHGVTERCIKNFDKLVEIIKENKFPPNITLNLMIKGTWDLETIKQLNDKQKLIEFFQFYETYIEKIKNLNRPNIIMECTIPNIAVPTPATVEDGKRFAQLVQKCREIEQENITQHYFKYYNVITPFTDFDGMDTSASFTGMMACCGSGKQMVGFLPHNMISACHEGFTLLIDKYKEFAAKRSEKDLTVNLNKFFELSATPMCLTDDQYANHERKMKYISSNSSVQTSIATVKIMALAMAGLIEKKYVIESEALAAAKYVMQNTTFCIKVNYATTGSFVTEPNGMYILLLNGALQYLTKEVYLNDN